MAKRISEAAKLCECESEDCAAELPLKKRLKLLQADYDATPKEALSSNSMSPMLRLADVACALAAAADAAEISDDDGDHHDDSSVTTTEDDHSTAGSATGMPRRTMTVQQKPVKSVGPLGLPTRLLPLRAPSRFLPASQRRPVTKFNFCPAGKPLSCPTKLFKPKFVLGDIDSTLA